MFFIITTGKDCDGATPSNRMIDICFSEKVAKKICDTANSSSDGFIAAYVDKQTFDEHYRNNKMSFYYEPLFYLPK